MSTSAEGWRRWWSVAALTVVAGLTGCGPTEAEFKLNRAYALKQEIDNDASITDERAQDVVDVLTAFFGTPDEPHVPSLPDVDVASVLDADRLAMAAGPVGSDELGRPRGLYREHCAHCHGVTGDGMGPTAAFLNPYPRDYRRGTYKFKSTRQGVPPTDEDLHTILVNGIPGTAMPSFKLLPRDEIDALVDYVKYLSIRGQVERSLLEAMSEFEEGQRLIDLSLKDAKEEEKQELYNMQLAIIKDAATNAVGLWASANDPENVLAVPARPELDQQQAIERGRQIFYGAVANCVKCHGDAALGDGQTTDYDEWTKEYAPDRPELLARYLEAGVLEPRNIRPRNLRQGIYRGGRRPIDLYWRIMNGIEGTPMPGLGPNVVPEGEEADATKLTQEDVWCLIEYVRNLPYEPISEAHATQVSFQRERN